MACECESCGDSLIFGCEYCCGEELTCEHVHPRTGKCLDPLDCPSPCAGGVAMKARLSVGFPAEGDLSQSGEGSWFSPPGGPVFWANVDFSNSAPVADTLYEVPILDGMTASQVRAEFRTQLEGNGYTCTNVGDDVLRIVRDTAGAVAPAAQSGAFVFTDEFDGAETSEDDPCTLPRVESLPWDGYAHFTDAADEDAYEAARAACLETRATDLEACEAEESSCPKCECAVAASRTFTECMEDARIAAIPALLNSIQHTLDTRADCCRGEYVGCVAPLEQAYFTALAASEAGWATDEKEGILDYYAEEVLCDHWCPTTDEGLDAYSVGFWPLPDFYREAIRNCIIPDREAVLSEPRETRAQGIADCRRDEMVRRNRCNARERRCSERSDAEYVTDANACEAAFLACGCADPFDPACATAAQACAEAAIIGWTERDIACCKQAHPVVPHAHALADCLAEAWTDYAAAIMGCCYGHTECARTCQSLELEDQIACIQSCAAAQEGCAEGPLATYTAARAACLTESKGDCPDCFHPGTLPTPETIDCGSTTFYRIVCGAEEGGVCTATGLPCTSDGMGGYYDCDGNPGGTLANCCPVEDLGCPTEYHLVCGTIDCVKLYDEETCALVSDDCPATGVVAGAVPCVVTLP